MTETTNEQRWISNSPRRNKVGSYRRRRSAAIDDAPEAEVVGASVLGVSMLVVAAMRTGVIGYTYRRPAASRDEVNKHHAQELRRFYQNTCTGKLRLARTMDNEPGQASACDLLARNSTARD